MAPGLDIDQALPVLSGKQSAPHIFAALSADEIANAASLTASQWPEGTELYYSAITLEEPPKTEALKYLDAEHAGTTRPSVDRKAFVLYHLVRTDKVHEALVNLSTQTVEKNFRLGPNTHAQLSVEEFTFIEQLVRDDPQIKAAVEKLELPEGTVVVCDPWPYGSDGVDDDARLFQCFMYVRDPNLPNEPDGNHYALPLNFYPVIDGVSRTVLRIDYVPTGKDHTVAGPVPWKPRPGNEYMPAYNKLRTDLKPLQVVQPEGASFTVTEQSGISYIEWQKWSFKVTFNYREGMVLHDVWYDGRPLFYRLSLSDMNIPYADPRHPFHKKSAFDLGDVGAGVCANDLKLGCDCLGSIHYLSGLIANEKGGPLPMPNAVCIHEQDNGILWKHTNFRTGKAALTRNRELVLQSIITVANYEYILAFQFNQAAEVMYEVRATGILSTQPIDDDISVPWGTVVHPGVLAAHHQHIFSLRVDPMLDGHANRLVYDEAHAMPRSDFNPHGNGYTVNETVVETSGGYNTDPELNRIFKIQNVASKNPINGKPVAYKIMAPPFQKILSDEQSFNFKRAEFSNKSIYAVKYREGELFAGGKYTNGSRGGTGVQSWAKRQDKIVDEDLVVFVQFGINHVPRIEDFPVMPAEIIKVHLKPVNFFTKNPAIDVPPSTQAFNKSTLLSAQHNQGVETVVDGNGSCCA